MSAEFMTDQDFDAICKLLQAQSAMVLEPGKRYLVETRLTPILREHSLNSVGELLANLRNDATSNLRRQIVEAMVITESSFFRDHHPFEALRNLVIPELSRRRNHERRLNIWCAASAHGQEPYSIALLLREHFPDMANWRISLLATDLSREALDRARSGRYKQIEVNRGLPAPLLVKYFEQEGTDWLIDPRIKEMVDFQELNLVRPWPALPPMDMICIRNVMIYFSNDTKKLILERAARLLRPDGYLLLGGSETTINLVDSFRRVEPIKAGIYQLVR